MMAEVIWTKIFLMQRNTVICGTKIIRSEHVFENNVKKNNEKLYQFCKYCMDHVLLM